MFISKLANNITISPILTFAAEVNARISNGEKLHNLTVGDFNPDIYTIPKKLKQQIIKAYENNHTNYPGAFGLHNLRQSIKNLIQEYCQVDLMLDNILVASGSRPLIYSAYKILVDPCDKVIFPVPSWNNDYYTMLSNANAIPIETKASNNFMPTRAELLPHIKNATLLALCSPQNPTGTMLSKKQLSDICELVVMENARRSADEKPLYVIFDQVYWLLAFNKNSFFHAMSINNKISDYAIFIDGMSKSFAGTGIRVGWATGPAPIIAKMRSLIAHLGAWAPKAEQFATGEFLANINDVQSYLSDFNQRLQSVLQQLHLGFTTMHNQGLPVCSINPEASIYLSISLDLIGKTTKQGQTLEDADAVQQFLLNDAKIAILPFAWFGAKNCPSWYRISIGTCNPNLVDEILKSFEVAITSLH